MSAQTVKLVVTRFMNKNFFVTSFDLATYNKYRTAIRPYMKTLEDGTYVISVHPTKFGHAMVCQVKQIAHV